MNAQHAWQLALYVVLPYVSLTIFVLGHVWRYRSDQFGWTSRSTQLYEKKMLILGSPLFHYGTLMAIAGHALGLLIPATWTDAIGLVEHPYTILSKVAGSAAAILVFLGLVVLSLRRATRDRIRMETTAVDLAAFSVLWVMILLGTWLTIGHSVLGPGYNYRPTISLWMRGIFGFQPDVGHMSGVPVDYQIHASLAWVYLALFPFTRFVHLWSAPVWYLTRPFVVYRQRRRERAVSPGEATQWQTFGGRRDRA